jgi:hypothetical protein
MPTSEEDAGSGQNSEDELKHELLVSNTRLTSFPEPTALNRKLLILEMTAF